MKSLLNNLPCKPIEEKLDVPTKHRHTSSQRMDGDPIPLRPDGFLERLVVGCSVAYISFVSPEAQRHVRERFGLFGEKGRNKPHAEVETACQWRWTSGNRCREVWEPWKTDSTTYNDHLALAVEHRLPGVIPGVKIHPESGGLDLCVVSRQTLD
jgi:hypothetical protein